MRLRIAYPRAFTQGLIAGLIGLWMPYLQAVQLNFSANIIPGSCTFSLSEGTVDLGTLSTSGLQPETLLAAKSFTLAVSNCSGSAQNLTPVVSITGDGMSQDGRWLFRAADSAARNVGVMLVNSPVMPDYSSSEVKSGDTLPLAVPGSVPGNQNILFYAGATCGSAASCASVGTGSLLARITFSLDYR